MLPVRTISTGEQSLVVADKLATTRDALKGWERSTGGAGERVMERRPGDGAEREMI